MSPPVGVRSYPYSLPHPQCATTSGPAAVLYGAFGGWPDGCPPLSSSCSSQKFNLTPGEKRSEQCDTAAFADQGQPNCGRKCGIPANLNRAIRTDTSFHIYRVQLVYERDLLANGVPLKFRKMLRSRR